MNEVNLQSKKTYEIIIKEVTHTQYAKEETFYLEKDGKKKYWSDEPDAKKITQTTGEFAWSEDTETIYNQKVSELNLEKVIAVVNKL